MREREETRDEYLDREEQHEREQDAREIAFLRAENERLHAAAREALAVLTRLSDSAAYWSDYDVPVGLVAEIDAAKARLAGVLRG